MDLSRQATRGILLEGVRMPKANGRELDERAWGRHARIRRDDGLALGRPTMRLPLGHVSDQRRYTPACGSAWLVRPAGLIESSRRYRPGP